MAKKVAELLYRHYDKKRQGMYGKVDSARQELAKYGDTDSKARDKASKKVTKLQKKESNYIGKKTKLLDKL